MIMASEKEVKQYLAYWFQLGKGVLLNNTQETLLPHKIISGDRYSQEFEHCWQKILDPQNGDCYLEGTTQTVAELLSSTWSINSCCRCGMPVPMIELGIQSNICPCHDLPDWPNNELPLPRTPIDSQEKLKSIYQRLGCLEKDTKK